MSQSTIAVAFFPPYICLQIFGPILVRKIGPTRYLSGVCFLWGTVMVGSFESIHSEASRFRTNGLSFLLALSKNGLKWLESV